jgi:hypothetical protein
VEHLEILVKKDKKLLLKILLIYQNKGDMLNDKHKYNRYVWDKTSDF